MIQDIAPHKYDITYRSDPPEHGDIMLIYRKEGLLCRREGDSISYPRVEEIAAVYPQVYEKAKFLFRIDHCDYYELRSPEIDPFDCWDYITRNDLRPLSPGWLVFAGITGFQIHDWYSAARFCGRCGTKLQAPGNERAMACPQCGRIQYPQICPSVIVGVTDGDRLLLTKYAPSHSAHRRYALVAGYTEIGESFEDTVRREVLEEVGLQVKNIRYFASQPWSFSGALLAGFFCDVDGSTEITLDENELSVAEWFAREDIPDNATISLTGTMMKAFKEGLV